MDSRQQFPRVEGLRKIVIGAHFQPDDSIDFITFCGEHHDRCSVILSAHAAKKRQTIFAGQHEIQDNQIERLALHQAPH